jgi:cytochrome c peroxidase
MSSLRRKTGNIGRWAAAAIVVVVLAAWLHFRPSDPGPWTEAEIEILQSLWIGSLPPVPVNPGNAFADDPRAADLGHRLFFDPRLSATGGISCSTCHQPERRFSDGLAKGQAIGTSKRNTRSIVGVAYSPWLYWDGRRDSLWSQALTPLEDPAEHGGSREQYVNFIASDEPYRVTYEVIFGELPELSADKAIDEVFANIGKAIAAYERLIVPGPSRFDSYVEAVFEADEALQNSIFTSDEALGLRLFIDAAACIQCHNGPLFTNHEFHNTGVISFPGEVPDKGRIAGVREVQADPFNCLGEFSDATAGNCAELEFSRTGPELLGAVRTPSLRNLESTAPFMHKGQIATLAEVLQHYNEAPLAMIGHNEAEPLQLNSRELRQLEAFLNTLAAPLATADKWLKPPATSLANNGSKQ